MSEKSRATLYIVAVGMFALLAGLLYMAICWTPVENEPGYVELPILLMLALCVMLLAGAGAAGIFGHIMPWFERLGASRTAAGFAVAVGMGAAGLYLLVAGLAPVLTLSVEPLYFLYIATRSERIVVVLEWFGVFPLMAAFLMASARRIHSERAVATLGARPNHPETRE